MSSSRVYLSGRFFIVISGWLLIGVLSISWPPLFLLYLALIPLLIGVSYIDFCTIPTRYSYVGEITGPRSPEIGESISLSIRIKLLDSQRRISSQMSVILEYREMLVFEKPLTPFNLASHSLEIWFEAIVKAQARRIGYVKLNKILLIAKSPFGFWIGKQSLEITPFTFRIIPQLKKIPNKRFQEMITSQRLLAQGSRLRMRNLSPDQYYTSREFRYPDSFRHIDHKSSAKYGKLMTKTYDSILQQHLVIILDLGRGMCGEISGSPKHDYYLSAALALGEYAVRSGDQVSFVALSQNLHCTIPRTRSLHSFQPLFQGGDLFTAYEVATNYQILKSALASIAPQRSLVVVLSDCSLPSVQDELSRALLEVCRKHSVVVVGLINRDYELPLSVDNFLSKKITNDSYSDLLYRYWLDESFNIFKKRMALNGGAALCVPEDYWMNACVRVYEQLRSSLNV